MRITQPLARILKATIIGPPGSGKGTVSGRILKNFDLKHLSSGDILRDHINKGSEFGKKIQPIVAAGQLVPFELLAPLMEYEIKETKGGGWLLDGYPRSVEQAERLSKTFPPNIAIHLNVPFETIIDRIKARWVHLPSNRVYNLDFNPPKVPGKDDETGDALVQREDDKPESVKKRLEVYRAGISPVLEFYRKQGVLKEFSGTETNVIWPHVQECLLQFTKGS